MICRANQFTVFHMIGALVVKGLNRCNIEEKSLRAKHFTYISETLRKAIMRISSLIRVSLKKGDCHALITYKKDI